MMRKDEKIIWEKIWKKERKENTIMRKELGLKRRERAVEGGNNKIKIKINESEHVM